MIARPPWEKQLREKLRKRRKRQLLPRWLMEHIGLILVLFCLQIVMVHGGQDTLGTGGGGTGIGAVNGLVGALIAVSLRSRWQSHGWLLDWTPATPAAAWKLRTREHLPAITITILITLLLTCVAAALHGGTSIAIALAAGIISMGCGFLLAGGKISTGLLYAGVVLVFFYTVISGWSGSGADDLSMRMAKGTSWVWLPIMPWSLATHGTPAPAIHLPLLLVALLISIYEWRSAWRLRSVHEAIGPEIAIGGAPESPEETEATVADEDETSEAVDQDQRQNIRQHVAFAWFGMAGYIPDGPMPRFERLQWRWFSPRERFLSCLGSQQSWLWFPRTRWTVGALAMMVVLALLTPWLNQLPFIGDHVLWLFVSYVMLAVIAVFTGWPDRDSSFQSWLDLMHTADLGHFPAFAVLPVTAGEWLRAAAKEWAVRSLWIATLWMMSILVGSGGIAPDIAGSWRVAFAAIPWLVLVAWFPLSVMYRLARAVSGPIFRGHGITRIVPALLCGVAGLVAMAVAFMGIGAGSVVIVLAALAVAVLLVALSLWLSLQRCRGMKLDIKPKPLTY
jgi:hypothetical protein